MHQDFLVSKAKKVKSKTRLNTGLIVLNSGSTVDTNKTQRVGRNTQWWVTCHVCNKSRYVQIGNWDSFNGKHHHCRGKAPRGTPHGNCKGGDTIDTHGYKLKLIHILPDNAYRLARTMNGQRKYILEHRLVMAMHLQRALKSDEVVHHVDGVKTNNQIENLFLTNRAEHTGEHCQVLRKLKAEIRRLQLLLEEHSIEYAS